MQFERLMVTVVTCVLHHHLWLQLMDPNGACGSSLISIMVEQEFCLDEGHHRQLQSQFATM